MARLIQTEDLVTNFYTYEGVVRALNGFSLIVDRGTTFGLVGESGCGKTVAVRSMMRIIREPGKIEGGKVILFCDDGAIDDGLDLLQQTEAAMENLRGDRISMIFQEPNAALNPIMRIGDQVSESFLFHRTADMCRGIVEELASPGCRAPYPLRNLQLVLYRLAAEDPNALILKIFDRIPILRRWRLRLKREAMSRSVEIIGKLGIPNPEDIVNHYPHHLSGGMKQRIVIAIALACRPLLLIADEATSNLDVTIQAQILELIRRLKQTEIASILLITHDLGVVAETCDRVGVMYAGNLCEVANVRDLFQSARHPYTRALLDAVPRFAQEGPLRSIEGAVPNLVHPPPGCRFHPRCPHAMDVCRERFPKQVEVSNGHCVSCYLYTDEPRRPIPHVRGGTDP
jgi:peptide/nickel transport system ATP-binding protein